MQRKPSIEHPQLHKVRNAMFNEEQEDGLIRTLAINEKSPDRRRTVSSSSSGSSLHVINNNKSIKKGNILRSDDDNSDPGDAGNPDDHRVKREVTELIITEDNIRLGDEGEQPKHDDWKNSDLFSVESSSSDENAKSCKETENNHPLSPAEQYLGTNETYSFDATNVKLKENKKTRKRGLRKNEIKQLQSESQRLAREKIAVVPKHRPKQLSLKEFLENRKSSASKGGLKEIVSPPTQPPLSKSNGFVERWLDDNEKAENVPVEDMSPAENTGMHHTVNDDVDFPSMEELERKAAEITSAPPQTNDCVQVQEAGQRDPPTEKRQKRQHLFKNPDILKLQPKIRPPSTGIVDLTTDGDQVGKSSLDLWFEQKVGTIVGKQDMIKPAKAKDVPVGVVSLEKDENGEEIVERKVLRVTPVVTEPTASGSSFHKPGGKLMKLKQSLEEQLRVKRQKEFQRRTEEWKQENGTDTEESEKEMSDTSSFSDSDEENLESGAEADGEQDEDDDELVEKSTVKNRFLDDEAHEDWESQKLNVGEASLHLELTGVPETFEEEVDFEKELKPSGSNPDSDIGSVDKEGMLAVSSNVDVFSSHSINNVATDDGNMESTKYKDKEGETQQLSHCSSQSYRMDEGNRTLDFSGLSLDSVSHDAVSVEKNLSQIIDNNKLHLRLPDSLSQLDVDLSSDTVANELFRLPASIEQERENKKCEEVVSDELLLLCSGPFPASSESQSGDKNVCLNSNTECSLEENKANLSQTVVEENAKDWLDDSDNEIITQKRSTTQTQILSDEDEDGVVEEEVERASSVKGHVGSYGFHEEEVPAQEQNSSDDEVAVVRKLQQAENKNGIHDSTGRLRADFFENEAELSGSDASEDEELGSEADVMEAEEGDLDELPSESKLRAQVGKFFMKQEMDDDKRKLLLYQEALLDDGDLYSDNQTRRFRWRRQGQEDVSFEQVRSQVMDGEDGFFEDEEVESSLKERAERTKWELTHSSWEAGKNEDTEFSEGEDEIDGNELLAFGRMAVRKLSHGSSVPGSVSRSFSLSAAEKDLVVTNCRQQGSLLHRNSAVLLSIAKSAPSSNVSLNPQKSVFTRISPGKVRAKKRKADRHLEKLNEEKDKELKILNENSNSVFELF